LGVVSIRVEGALITIADGSITIEQTRTDQVAAAAAASTTVRESLAAGVTPKVEAAAPSGAVPASAVITERVIRLPEGVDGCPRDSGGGNSTIFENSVSVIAPHRPLPPGRNGPAGLSGASGKGQEAPSGQTKPAWTDEEIEKLRALYPTHSAGAIAVELGRGLNAVRAKVQHLGLKKDGPPTVKLKSVPRSLSAAVPESLLPVPLPSVPDGFNSVLLLDHRPGQCRWIISDVWPVVYCGAPVVDSSSWCGKHSRRVFIPDGQRRAARKSHA
jgi:hypothetical protein